MPRAARPVATAAMNGWLMPAPAPWANTKQARAGCGRVRSAETEADFPASIVSFCVGSSFIARASLVRDKSAIQFSDFEVLIICIINRHCEPVVGARRRPPSEAIQSRVRRSMDCFVASAFARRRASADKRAPRNDGGISALSGDAIIVPLHISNSLIAKAARSRGADRARAVR